MLSQMSKDISVYGQEYKKLKELGRGKFGIVFRVKSHETGQDFAAKYVKSIKREVKDQLAQEISIMNSLQSPHIVNFVEVFDGRTETVIVTEYLSGGELFEKVSSEEFHLTERECIAFISQVCSGVAYLHDQKVVHLDLKPENIVLCNRDSNNVKIIDFGLAQRVEGSKEIKTLSGTAEFVAPEVVNYEPVGFESDCWAIGIITYVLLSGLSPFLGDSDAETYSNILNVQYDFDCEEFEEITEEAKNFIESLLLKQKQKRLSAKECLNHQWLAKTKLNQRNGPHRINTVNHKKFVVRRRWQKCQQAIRAAVKMKRLSKAFSTTAPDSALKRISSVQLKRTSLPAKPIIEDINGDESKERRASSIVPPAMEELCINTSSHLTVSSSLPPSMPSSKTLTIPNNHSSSQTPKLNNSSSVNKLQQKANDNNDSGIVININDSEDPEDSEDPDFVYPRVYKSTLNVVIK